MNNILTDEQRQYYIEYFSKSQGRMYPCSNQIVICGIFSNKNEIEIAKIMEDYGYQLYKITKYYNEWKSHQERWLYFKNIESWKSRGYRFYKIMVDKDINKEFFQQVLLPCCAGYCCKIIFI